MKLKDHSTKLPMKEILKILYLDMDTQVNLLKNRLEIQAPISFSYLWNTKPCIGRAHDYLYTYT